MKSSPRTELPDRPPLPTAAPDEVVVDPVGMDVDGALLAEVADCADLVDRTMARLATRLLRVMDRGVVETRTRLSTRLWLETTCRLPASDARRLVTTVDTLRHLPATATGIAQGWLSWAQTVRICAAARTVPAGRRAELDELVAGALHEYRTYHPDELVDRVWQLADSWQPSRLEKLQRSFADDEFVVLQPQLDGGGSIYGQFGPANFAILAEALDAPIAPPTTADLDQAVTELDEQRRHLAIAHGRRLGQQLVALCEATLAGATRDGETVPPRPNAYVVTTLDALCDRDQTPGWLLHTLVGGRMRMTAAGIRRMVDERGADLRTIVLDDHGRAIGVGRRTRVAPGWLRDAAMVRDLVDQAPGGRTPVRRADLDHITRWEDGGRTDAANLQAVGRRGHTAKTRGHWTVTRSRDGTTTWHHRDTGVTVRRPPTWRGLPARPPDEPPDG